MTSCRSERGRGIVSWRGTSARDLATAENDVLELLQRYGKEDEVSFEAYAQEENIVESRYKVRLEAIAVECNDGGRFRWSVSYNGYGKAIVGIFSGEWDEATREFNRAWRKTMWKVGTDTRDRRQVERYIVK